MPANVSTPSATHRTYSFGEFTLDLDRGALRKANQDIKLRPKSFEVLIYLVERQGLLVTKDELLDAIWGQTIVTEDSVTQCLIDIRKAIRDQSQEMIRTVPRRGYIFEIPVTKHGGPVTASDVPSRSMFVSSWPRWSLAAALVLVLGMVAALWEFGNREVEVPVTVAPHSIAVLPFADLSPEQDQAYFADGISEEILNLLAWMPGLRVIARTSSFSFKGTNVDIATIAEQLNVAYVLEGSFRRDGDRVRITAQLIEAKDSMHVWSQTYDQDLSAANLFHIQSEIARAITGQLRTTLTEAEERRLEAVPTENSDAYVAYLIGRHRLADRKVEGLGAAVEQFAKAIELDPEFAAAYSGLADACYLYASYSGGHIHESCPASQAWDSSQAYAPSLIPLVEKALELDDTLGEAWISLAQLLKVQVNGYPESMPQLREAHAAFERGLALNPSHAQGYLWYALSLPYLQLYEDHPHGWIAAWKQDTWQSVVRRGLEVDPLSVPLHNVMAAYPNFASTQDEAFRHARRITEIAPDSPRGYYRLAELSWTASGRIDEAIKWFSKTAAIDPGNPDVPLDIGNAYAALGDFDMALAYFAHARQIVSPQAKRWQHIILMNEAAALLGARDDQSAEKAKERLAQSEIYDEKRLEIELSFDHSPGRAEELLARFEEQNPECFTEKYEDWCPIRVYLIYQELGDHDRAQAGIESQLKDHWNWYDWRPQSVLLYIAQELAILGRLEEALEKFEELVQSGWRSESSWRSGDLRFLLYRDIAFDALRDHPRFQAMVAVIEADMAEQLENVREMERRGELPTLDQLRAELNND